jgi:hypothetical protein
MRQDIGAIDRLVRQAVDSGEFSSKEECVSAMVNWLVLNGGVNPSRVCCSGEHRETDNAPEDERGACGVNQAEEALLHYEILRERDA